MKKIVLIVVCLIQISLLSGCIFTNIFPNYNYEVDIDKVSRFLELMNENDCYKVSIIYEEKSTETEYPREFDKMGNAAKLISCVGEPVTSDIYIFNEDGIANRYYGGSNEILHGDLTDDILRTNYHDFVSFAYYDALKFSELFYQKCLTTSTVTIDDFRYDPVTKYHYYYSDNYVEVLNNYVDTLREAMREEGQSETSIVLTLMQMGLIGINYTSSAYSLLAFDFIEDENNDIIKVKTKMNLGGISIHSEYSNFDNVSFDLPLV